MGLMMHFYLELCRPNSDLQTEIKSGVEGERERGGEVMIMCSKARLSGCCKNFVEGDTVAEKAKILVVTRKNHDIL